jgi:hypothetical protein
MTKYNVGDRFQCEYNGKFRHDCEVIEVVHAGTGNTVLVVKTQGGWKRFDVKKMRNVMVYA